MAKHDPVYAAALLATRGLSAVAASRVADLPLRVRRATAAPLVTWDCPPRIAEAHMSDSLTVRRGQWKLHVYRDGGPICELYDLENDVGETTAPTASPQWWPSSCDTRTPAERIWVIRGREQLAQTVAPSAASMIPLPSLVTRKTTRISRQSTT